MPFNIKVSNLDNNTYWEKQLTADEYQQVKEYLKGKPVISMIPAIFQPVRTNNFKNFSKDFFLPTTINHAIKVKSIVVKIFAILASLILDLLSFPIRILTVIPRVIVNAKQDKIKLNKYLIAQNADKKLIKSDHVRVRVEWEKTSQFSTSTCTTMDGVSLSKKNKEDHWREVNVNFREVPTYEDYDLSQSGMNQ